MSIDRKEQQPMKIVTLSPEQFDKFAQNHRYRNYYQSSAYGNVMVKFEIIKVELCDQDYEIIKTVTNAESEVFVNCLCRVSRMHRYMVVYVRNKANGFCTFSYIFV